MSTDRYGPGAHFWCALVLRLSLPDSVLEAAPGALRLVSSSSAGDERRPRRVLATGLNAQHHGPTLKHPDYIVSPRMARLVLRLFVPATERETVLGDLEEEFRTQVEPRLGRSRAHAWYWKQAVSLAVMYVASRHRERRSEDRC